MRLVSIFGSKEQTKLLEHFLENKGRVFNQASLARFLDASPSTIARVVQPLIRERIVLYERFQEGMKILCLNEEEEKTRVLLEFYEKIRRL